MSKRIFTCIAMFAMVLMVSAAFAQQGGFIVNTLQAKGKDYVGNNGFDGRCDLEVTVEAPDGLLVGMDACIKFTITNRAGRAIPDITAWLDPVFKKFDKNGVGQYDGGYISGGLALGKDSLGRPITSVSLSDKGTLEFTIPVDTSKPAIFVFDTIEIWTRLGNKNFQDQLYGSLRGDAPIVIEIIAPQPTLPPGIVFDREGNLLIFAVRAPNNTNKGWAAVTICEDGNNPDDDPCLEWASTSKGATQCDSNGDRIKVKAQYVVEGFYWVAGEFSDINSNKPEEIALGLQTIAFYLGKMDDGQWFGYTFCYYCGPFDDCDCE